MGKKKFTILGIGILLLALLVSACGQAATPASAPDESYYGYSDTGTTGGGGNFAEEEPMAPSAGEDFDYDGVPGREPGLVGGEQDQQVQRLIIRTGNISVAVDDTRVSKEAIEEMVNGMTAQVAFVVSSNEYGGDQDTLPTVNMTIRIPAERFDEVMDTISEMAAEGTSASVSSTAEDVSEEYVDLEAQLESLEAARLRLLEIMENAQTTQELLEAEQQLTMREAEIASIKGRMEFLSESAALSVITIELRPYFLAQPVDTRWRPAETVREAIEDLLQSLQGAAEFLIYVTIFCGPWLLLLVPIIFGAVLLIRRFVFGQRRQRRAVRPVPAAEETEIE